MPRGKEIHNNLTEEIKGKGETLVSNIIYGNKCFTLLLFF